MKIGIIGAMEVEVVKLRDQLANRNEQRKGSFVFYTGTLNNVEIVLLQSGIGKVNAAIGAALLIDNFQPDYVINTGAAGGFPGDLKVGDIVISEEVIHHDMDCTVFGYKIGQVPGMPASFIADEKLIALAEKSVHLLTDLQTKKACILTGDQFMNNADATNKIKTLFPTAEAVEMEGAAIAQTCYQFSIPFVVIRSISDIAGQENDIEYQEFVEIAAVNSAKMVTEMVRELGNQK
ncbi:5'-methylthioadenosine/S-adenosylhomocysteine nucleosidase [Labilibaculum antarcticum]|uniref:5'-methylthioadenosine/S-adenosylhomocysteine nucleosidase n=1 Tax=Labilibaculum antarcticum TaxID=1717717 RepID=A0A1Y1CNR9_9BACT|nr:5'-methylthioadenosine/S-adenosylhomocysteine nucleosidase [Labilibaculum antarcticum]BAX82089.1 5'-methylthioadenosine/S-adenosylhomocysteine nucleosidase [Labilibaculum antarcticum]